MKTRTSTGIRISGFTASVLLAACSATTGQDHAALHAPKSVEPRPRANYVAPCPDCCPVMGTGDPSMPACKEPQTFPQAPKAAGPK
jgi:hypothetical protein